MTDDIGAIARLSARGWITLRQFADLIDVTPVTVYKMRDRGQVNVIKVGEHYRVYTDEVRRFLEEGNEKGGGP